MLRSLFGLCLVAALAVGSAAPLAAAVVIHEISYNSPGTPDVEFVELYNTGPSTEVLTGWYLLDDDNTHPHCLLAGSLAPGAYLVVTSSLALFSQTYPGVTAVNPNAFGGAEDPSGWALGNGTDVVRLFDSQGALVDAVAYQDTAPWPVAADGFGSTLELRNPLADNANPASWGASVGGPPPGTPGAANSIFVADVPPVVQRVERQPPLPTATATVTIRAEVTDDQSLAGVDLYVDLGAGFAAVAMFDDGLHGDGSASDSVYGTSIAPQTSGALVRYYVSAADGAAQSTTAPATAPAAWYAYTVDHVPPPLAINEILADNRTVLADELGDFDDWVEIRNAGPDPVDLGGMYLTDDLADPLRFALPATVLAPGALIVVWCDGEPGEGPLHASFALSRAGGAVGLFDTVAHGNARIDVMTYGPQNPDVAFGFRPEGAYAPEYLVAPTPGADNAAAVPFSAVCLNEFLASGAAGAPDWIELYNRSPSAVDLGGWRLSDDPTLPSKYVLPPGTLLGAGSHLVLPETTLGFALSATGDESILLTAADGVTAQDWFDFGPQTTGISQGRVPDGAPDWHFLVAPSPGYSNDCAPVQGPGAVTGLRFSSPTALDWSPLDGVSGYDLVSGDLLALRASGGSFAGAITACVEDNGRDARGWAGSAPPAGGAWFYLVRGVDFACGFGTYDTDSDGQVAPRDAEIRSAAGTCP